jgi:hypothetical protein
MKSISIESLDINSCSSVSYIVSSVVWLSCCDIVVLLCCYYVAGCTHLIYPNLPMVNAIDDTNDNNDNNNNDVDDNNNNDDDDNNDDNNNNDGNIVGCTYLIYLIT